MKANVPSNDISFLLGQVRDIPLLTKDEVIVLSSQVQEGISAQAILDTTEVDFAIEEVDRLRTIIRIGLEAKNKFVTSNMLLVVSIAKRYSYKDIDMMELIQEGSFGLIRAAEKFDATRGIKFGTYASYWVSVYISKYIDKTSGLLYIPNYAVQKLNKYCKLYNKLNVDDLTCTDAEFSNIGESEMGEKDFKNSSELYKVTQKMFSLYETIQGSDFVFEDIILEEESDNLEDSIILKLDMNQAVDEALLPIEKEVIIKRFGMNGQGMYSIAEIAKQLPVTEDGDVITKDKVRKLEKIALKKLKEYLISNDYGV